MSENVKGLKKLIATLEKIPKELDKEVDALLFINAQRIEGDAKINAPVDTGKLQQSIRAIRIGKLNIVIKANATGKAPYAIYVEFGTRFQTRQPFLYPTFFKGRQRLINDLEDLIERKIGKI